MRDSSIEKCLLSIHLPGFRIPKLRTTEVHKRIMDVKGELRKISNWSKLKSHFISLQSLYTQFLYNILYIEKMDFPPEGNFPKWNPQLKLKWKYSLELLNLWIHVQLCMYLLCSIKYHCILLLWVLILCPLPWIVCKKKNKQLNMNEKSGNQLVLWIRNI